jgi:hypothetical protein
MMQNESWPPPSSPAEQAQAPRQSKFWDLKSIALSACVGLFIGLGFNVLLDRIEDARHHISSVALTIHDREYPARMSDRIDPGWRNRSIIQAPLPTVTPSDRFWDRLGRIMHL